MSGKTDCSTLLVCTGVIGLLFSAGMTSAGFINEATAQTKLDQDVGQLNRAVKVYAANGGSLQGVRSVEDALDVLKSAVPEESTAITLALRDSMIDHRLEAVIQSSEEASGSGVRVLWDSSTLRFVQARSGAGGAAKFVLNETASLSAGTQDRSRVWDGARTGGWVWGFNDDAPAPAKAALVVGRGAPADPALSTPPDEDLYSNPYLNEAMAGGEFLAASISIAGIRLGLGPLGELHRQATSPFDESSPVGVHIGTMPGLITGVKVTGSFFSEASSNVDQSAGVKWVTGVGEAASLNIGILYVGGLGLLGTEPLLRIRAVTLRSSSTITGDINSMQVSGRSVIANLSVEVLGRSAVTLAHDGTVNQVVQLAGMGLPGISIVLNHTETESGADGMRKRMAVCRHALSVKIDNFFLSGGVVDGEVNVGTSTAELLAAR